MANEVKETPAVPVAPIGGDQITLTEVQGETSDFLERNQKTILLVVGLLFDEDGSILPATKSGAIGDALAQKGDLDGAEGYYKTAVSEAGENTLLAPYFLNKLGLLRERQGNKAAANELYKRIQIEFPNSNEAQDIQKFLMRTAG